MRIPLNVIDVFKYPLKSVKNSGKFTRTRRRNAGAFRTSSVRRKIRLNKKCRENPNSSLVFNISFGVVFFLFDLCKPYRSLDILICIQRWLKMPHLKTFLGPVNLHFTRKGQVFQRNTSEPTRYGCQLDGLITVFPLVSHVTWHLTTKVSKKTCLYFRVVIPPKRL